MNLKKKLVAGAVTVSLVTGAGVAFASFDAGEKLQAWYNGVFGEAASDVGENVYNHAYDKVPGVEKDFNTGKSEVTKQINAKKVAQVGTSSNSINGVKDGHIANLDAKQTALEENLAAEFDAFASDFKTNTIDKTANTLLGWAKGQFDTHSATQGANALANLESELEVVTNDAKTELEQAISDAKSELQTKIDTEAGLTEGELKQYVDNKISQLRSQMGSYVVGLISAQKKAISDKATEIEDAAKTELDSIVENF